MSEAINPELKITVQNDGSVDAVVTGTGDSADDGKVETDDLLRETLGAFRDWLNQGKLNIQNERELKLLGKLLHRLLLGENSGEKIRKLIREQMAAARKAEKRICLQLAFKEGQAELASLPWEFLYDPDSNSFYATTNDLILTRFVKGDAARQALLSNEPPLRMLIVVSKRGGKTVASQAVVEAIQEFARDNSDKVQLAPPLIDPTPLGLQDELEKQKDPPQIIHFIGHGRYNKATRQGEIALARLGSADEADWVDHDKFRRLFTNSGCIPRLLFLQLCEGAVVEGGELIASFEGLAPALIAANVQAVVAMQFPIKNIHAGLISKRFYEELTKGRSVGEAVQAARRMVSMIDPVAGGTPVLYMYGFDRSLVEVARETPGVTPRGTLAGNAVPTAEPPPRRPDSGAPGSVGSAAMQPTAPIPRSTPDARLLAETEILSTGTQSINALRGKYPPKEVPNEILVLSKRYYIEVVPRLKGRSVAEMQEALGNLCQLEAGTPLRKVLEDMLDTALKMA